MSENDYPGKSEWGMIWLMTGERAGKGTPWPPDDIRHIVDALGDGLVILDPTGQILYVNPAGEEVLGWPRAELAGMSVGVLLGQKYPNWTELFGDIVHGDRLGLVGKRLDVALTRRDGQDVHVEVVISVGMSRFGNQVVIGLLRAHDGGPAERMSAFTRQLLDVLTVSSANAPTAQLLGALGHRLEWDVAALWGLEPDGSLICRGVWTTPEAPADSFVAAERRDPGHDSGGLARMVMERGEPLWLTDLASDARFTDQATRADGLTTACAFPVAYGGQCVGAIKMMSRAQRMPDPNMIEVVTALTGYFGEILHALEQNAERQRILGELEETKQKLQFLLRANGAVSNAAGYEHAIARLAEVAVPTMGDLCLIDVIDENGVIRRLGSQHRDPEKQHLADELREHYPPDPTGSHPSTRVISSGTSQWSADMPDQFLRETTRDDRHFAILKELEFTSYMSVPLIVDGRTTGTVTLVSAGSGRRYAESDLQSAEELAAQVTGVIERTRIFDREHHIAHTLQTTLLPYRLPDVPGLELATRYVPAASDIEVGGDWFDVIPLSHGRAALVVGDVQGHDVMAASIMGQIRHAMSLLLFEGASPSDALERVNHFLRSTDISSMATALVAIIDPAATTLRMASAGHPSPAAVGPKGPRIVEVKPGPPLGMWSGHYTEESKPIGDETLVLFTDGLIERRNRHPDDGIRLLKKTLENAPDLAPGHLVGYVLSRLLADGPQADDVAILAARRTIP